MSSNHLLLRPSLRSSSPKLLPKPSPFSLPPPSNLTFRTKKIPPLNSLSISSPPQFPTTPFQPPNPIFINFPQSKKPLCCHATSETVVPATDRLISIISYFIPFLGGLSFGFHLFSKYPILERVFDPLVPLLSFYKSIPGVNFLTFFGLYLGVVRDRKFSRFVRFNALQAVFLEFLLVVPSLLNLMVTYGEGVGFKVLQVVHSGVFVFIFACFVYAVLRCLFGRTPNYPLVSDAMDARLRAEDRCG